MRNVQFIQSSHPDSRNMCLAPKEHWPSNGVVIKSSQTPATIVVLWSPKETLPDTPWVVSFYLEWGPDWNCRWSRRFSTEELSEAFALSNAPHSVFKNRAYCRRGRTVTLPTTQLIDVDNGDQVCQANLRDDMIEALQHLVDEKMSKIVPDAPNT